MNFHRATKPYAAKFHFVRAAFANHWGQLSKAGKVIEKGFKGGYYAYKNLSSFKNQRPNVGGVYLDKVAEVLGKLGEVETVTFDPNSQRLLFIGPDSKTGSLSSVRLDHLATAFRTVFGNYLHEPGVTIDPNPKNPHGKADIKGLDPENCKKKVKNQRKELPLNCMEIKFFGGVENTHFGYLLLESDRLMKALSMGEDNVTRQPVSADIEGYHNLIKLEYTEMGGNHDKKLFSRFWLEPVRVVVQLTEDGNSIAFTDTKIRVKTQTMRWSDETGKLIPAGKNHIDKKAEYFAGHFTEYYDKYAEQFPVFRKVKSLANLVALAKWLKLRKVNLNLDWLKDFETFYETETGTPSFTAKDPWPKGISIFGGNDLTVKLYKEDPTKIKKYLKNATQAVPLSAKVETGMFTNGESKKKKSGGASHFPNPAFWSKTS